jgi:hypothetical protein
MSFEKKALKELLRRSTAEEAKRALGKLVDSLPEELNYADLSSKDVADGILTLLTSTPDSNTKPQGMAPRTEGSR